MFNDLINASEDFSKWKPAEARAMIQVLTFHLEQSEVIPMSIDQRTTNQSISKDGEPKENAA